MSAEAAGSSRLGALSAARSRSPARLSYPASDTADFPAETGDFAAISAVSSRFQPARG
jgi:hypothetical protein